MVIPESSGQLYAECAANVQLCLNIYKALCAALIDPSNRALGSFMVGPGAEKAWPGHHTAVWLSGSARIISSQGSLSAKQCSLPPSPFSEITGKPGGNQGQSEEASA